MQNLRRTVFAFMLLAVCPLSVAVADSHEQEINAAQQLVFLDAHLGATHPGSVLSYRFERRSKADDGFTDTVRMFVTAEDGAQKRDLRFDFLSGDQRIDFQPTRGYISNPLIVLFLERDVRDMSRGTGGAAAHFRNQIRQSFNDPQMETTRVVYREREIDAVKVTVVPFRRDPYIKRFPDYAEKHYEFVFARELPGELYRIRTFVADPATSIAAEQMTFDQINSAR